MIADWRDGHFDRTYAPRCYRDAISALPEDIRIYSSAEQDINRALIASLAKRSTTTPKKVGAVKGIVRRLASAQPQAATQRQAAQAALDAGSTSLPVPVVVAAGAALLLVGTAVVSVLARRLRRRLF